MSARAVPPKPTYAQALALVRQLSSIQQAKLVRTLTLEREINASKDAQQNRKPQRHLTDQNVRSEQQITHMSTERKVVRDPVLAKLAKAGKVSYTQYVDNLIAQLDEAAANTRLREQKLAERLARRAAVSKG